MIHSVKQTVMAIIWVVHFSMMPVLVPIFPPFAMQLPKMALLIAQQTISAKQVAITRQL